MDQKQSDMMVSNYLYICMYFLYYLYLYDAYLFVFLFFIK